MKNYLQNGHIVRVTTPAGGIASGDALIVGSIFGIATYSSAEGDPVELSTTGVFQLPKASAAVLTVGARVAWDNTAKEVTTPAATLSELRWRPQGMALSASPCGWMGSRRRRREDQ
jgi:predicted RecA/RadA family phage recombinase